MYVIQRNPKNKAGPTTVITALDNGWFEIIFQNMASANFIHAFIKSNVEKNNIEQKI